VERTETRGSVETSVGPVGLATHGQGPPLLMINGYAATGDDWDPTLISSLGVDFSLICPDNRGMGRTHLEIEEMTISRLAGDTIALLDELGQARAHVLGWSMGGFVAQELAATYPDRVGGLVLAATDPGGCEAVLAGADVTARLYDSGGTPREQAKGLIALLFADELAGRIDAEFGEAVAAARAELSLPALRAQERAMDGWHTGTSAQRLASIAAPTLVMAGREDMVIPAANAEILSDKISGARQELFSGAGHGFIAQEAERVALAIRDHLR
jgi:pimeloyl-ACP methyl ester carboxylesterase